MEIELKLAIAPAQVAMLKRHPVLSGEGGKGPEHTIRLLHSTYLDTPDWALMHRGIALRLRRLDGARREWVQTLKAEAASVGALSSRPEWEVKLPRGRHDIAALPADAHSLLQGVDVSAIRGAFVTTFRRTTWLVHHEGAEMEVALDIGKIERVTSMTGKAQAAEKSIVPTELISELEIELKSGPQSALFSLAKTLMNTVQFELEPRSKAMRGYAMAGAMVGAMSPAPVRAKTPVLNPRHDGREVWRMLMAEALAQMVNNLPGMSCSPSDPEYLHQMRVGLRRLLTMTDLHPRFNAEKPAWRTTFKNLMQQLNAARDWDVFCDELMPTLDAGFAALPLSAAFKRSIALHRHRADADAVMAVRSQAFVRGVLEIGEQLSMPVSEDVWAEDVWTEATKAPLKTENMDARRWAATQLQQRWQRVLKRGKGFTKLLPHQRHALRIEVKRMRYAAEMLAPLFSESRSSKRFFQGLSELQTQLGAMQDGVVAMHLMASLESRSRNVLFDAGRVAGALSGRIGHADSQDQKACEKAWKALLRSKPFWL